MRAPKLQNAGGDVELEAAVAPMVQYVLAKFRDSIDVAEFQFVEHFHSFSEVHRLPVVWVSQTEVPDFVSLVKIRDSWRSHFEDELGARVESAIECDFFLQDFELV